MRNHVRVAQEAVVPQPWNVDEAGTGAEAARVHVPGGHEDWVAVELPPLPPGVYRCTAAAGYGRTSVSADVFTVFDVAHR